MNLPGFSVRNPVTVKPETLTVDAIDLMRRNRWSCLPVIKNGVAFIEPAACQGCGVCASACPRHTINTQHYKDQQIIAKLKAL